MEALGLLTRLLSITALRTLSGGSFVGFLVDVQGRSSMGGSLEGSNGHQQSARLNPLAVVAALGTLAIVGDGIGAVSAAHVFVRNLDTLLGRALVLFGLRHGRVLVEVIPQLMYSVSNNNAVKQKQQLDISRKRGTNNVVGD